jgi:hypothetical protein
MAMKKIKDVVYSEKYTASNGEEKTRYTNCGSLLQRDDGSLSIKLEAIPVGFTGWFNCYDPKPREEGAGQRGGGPVQQRSEQPKPGRGAPPSSDTFEEDAIPFISNRGRW